MDEPPRLRHADREQRLAALRELQDRGPAASRWLPNIIDHLSRSTVESDEWTATWQAAARVAANASGARVVQDSLVTAAAPAVVRGLLMVVMNLPQNFWPSGEELLRAAELGDLRSRGLALQLAVPILPRPRAHDVVLGACSDADLALQMEAYKALILLLADDITGLQEPRLFAALANAAVHGTKDIRVEVVSLLAQVTPLTSNLADTLAATLEDAHGDVRRKAAHSLLSNERHRNVAIETLARIIADEQERVFTRCDAMEELPSEIVRLPAIQFALHKSARSSFRHGAFVS